LRIQTIIAILSFSCSEMPEREANARQGTASPCRIGFIEEMADELDPREQYPAVNASESEDRERKGGYCLMCG
jgi:hypothetical protein